MKIISFFILCIIAPSLRASTTEWLDYRGPTTRGSLRDIRLLRKGKQVGSIDFYDYFVSLYIERALSFLSLIDLSDSVILVIT